MNRNFKFISRVEIRYGEQIYDLHNNYEVSSIRLDVDRSQLQLRLRALPGLAPKGLVALDFDNLIELEFFGNFGGRGVSGIADIGFKGASDFDYEWLSNEEQSKTDDRLVICFDNDALFRVYSKSARFIVLDTSSIKAQELDNQCAGQSRW